MGQSRTPTAPFWISIHKVHDNFSERTILTPSHLRGPEIILIQRFAHHPLLKPFQIHHQARRIDLAQPIQLLT